MKYLASVVLLLAMCGTPQLASMGLQISDDDGDVMKALDYFLSGWNSRDARQYAAALHFPHLILEGARYFEYPDQDQFVARGAAHWARVPPEWDHTVWEDRQIVQRIGDTVHVIGRWARVDKSGRVIRKADILYVVLKKNGRWGIFARSGNRAAQATSRN